ncbi:MAG: DUF4091 domain-containing protein [Ignavibacteriales bacterium]|nr:DUF4091 domain-containing protein [Ignavibacteriales bacterium]
MNLKVIMKYLTIIFLFIIIGFLFSSNIEFPKIVKKNPDSKADFYVIPPTKYNRLTGKNLPDDIKPLEKLTARSSPGEYLPLSFLIQANEKLKNIKIMWTDFIGNSGKIPNTALDVSIAKVWYQAGYRTSDNTQKILTQELLIKNDNLIKVDYEKEMNFILVKFPNGSESYVDVTTPTAIFPENGIIEDSQSLLPFSIEANFNKQIWLTIHIPSNVASGKYISQVTISDDNETLKSFPIEIEVLPFKLDESRITYGIYYHGYVDNFTKRTMHYTNKTEKQYRIEMKDLKEHGVLYPTTYQVLQNLDNDLKIRKEVGLQNDKIFTLGITTGNPQSESEINNLKENVKAWQNKITQFGYKELYVYGIDEARGDQLTSQRPAWKAVRDIGAKIFVAGYRETYAAMGDLLDVGIIQGELDKEQAIFYHSKKNKIFSYSNPQAGEENPEIYRRNYGIALWKAGYDGAMDYAYQKNYGSTWNDWDSKKYRDENFTYPTADGIISTIQWEGFREGVNDVRYLSTLLNKIDRLKAKGKDVSSLEQWINSIDTSVDLDMLRQQIIDKILSIE